MKNYFKSLFPQKDSFLLRASSLSPLLSFPLRSILRFVFQPFTHLSVIHGVSVSRGVRIETKISIFGRRHRRAPPLCLRTDIFSFGSYWHEGGPRVCTHAGLPPLLLLLLHVIVPPLAESPVFPCANSRPFLVFPPPPFFV